MRGGCAYGIIPRKALWVRLIHKQFSHWWRSAFVMVAMHVVAVSKQCLHLGYLRELFIPFLNNFLSFFLSLSLHNLLYTFLYTLVFSYSLSTKSLLRQFQYLILLSEPLFLSKSQPLSLANCLPWSLLWPSITLLTSPGSQTDTL
jgi:hypothetical protein